MNQSDFQKEVHQQVMTAMHNMDRIISDRHQNPPITFEEFLTVLTEKPPRVLRNVFQAFHDMIKSYVEEGEDEYPNDPESIHFVNYDCTELFVEGSDHPFFCRQTVCQPFGRTGRIDEKWHTAEQNLHFRRPPGLW